NIEASGTPLSAVTNLNLNVPAGSTVLINVSGNSTALNNITTIINGAAPTVAQAQYILWNMPIMTALTFNSNLFGSIMAPNANVTATGFGSL
ncbi:MAG: choice-of-anchor A family protein, partial [Flavobacterium sp.]